MGAGARLQLRKQVAHVGLDGLLGEEEPVTDLAVDEAVGDELEDLDLTRRWLLLQLLERAGERNDLGPAAATALRRRFEAAAVVHVTGQDLLALGSVHGNRDIGLGTGRL